MFNTLSRYLHHRRWVWEMQERRGPSMSMTAMGRILSTVVKSRLQEGFSFAHSSHGIINLVLEMEVQHPLCRPLGSGEPQTHPFVCMSPPAPVAGVNVTAYARDRCQCHRLLP
ncbi:KICSTOR complex protein SZT2-like [Pollicipes pollicipes]|uniref:KICSTOR complex protein SZT2-like n=1 Tax=Pollicipes pollicipes TaxID=41117 RepID=UPI0018855924|nr:KICSTOR complex protein SZT2-like [Pollicipes pollicipes]